jgi:hypothetical protein
MAIDKSKWPDGPWMNEVDQLGWIDEATGYACAIVRHGSSGHLCGYVEIPFGHPLHGVSYSAQITKTPTRPLFGGWFLLDHEHDSAGGLFNVHGGITYSGEAFWGDDSGHWYGFDCGHAWDVCPAIQYNRSYLPDSTYRDIEYVKAQCASLAKQLKDVSE